jgi:hypothetical protein
MQNLPGESELWKYLLQKAGMIFLPLALYPLPHNGIAILYQVIVQVFKD